MAVSLHIAPEISLQLIANASTGIGHRPSYVGLGCLVVHYLGQSPGGDLNQPLIADAELVEKGTRVEFLGEAHVQVVRHDSPVAALQQCIRQVRANKASPMVTRMFQSCL